MAPRDILPPTFDRDLWERRLEVPTEGGLSLSKITDRLGLKRKRGTRGRISFQSEKARRLSAAVAVLASKLPKDAARLIDRALDTGDTKNQLLQRFGEIIWGPEKSRPWLYEPSDGIDGYTHALRYSNQDDRAILNEQLRLWIIVKRINTLWYQKKKDKTAITPRTRSKSPKDSDETLTYDATAYDRTYSTQRLQVPTSSSLDLNICTIIKSLNLQRYDTGSDGNVCFENANIKALDNCISNIVDTLPRDRNELIDMAASPKKLQSQVDGLAMMFGQKIWGGDKGQQLPVHDDDKFGPDDLMYADSQDRTTIRHYLRLWIIIRAFNSLLDHENSLIVRVTPKISGTKRVTQEEKEVVFVDFGDDIEEISGAEWTPNTRVRPKRENRTPLSNTVTALQAHFEAAAITEHTPEPAETSPLQNDRNHQDTHNTPNDSHELVQDQVFEPPVAPTRLYDQEADLSSSESAVVRKESAIVAGADPDTVIAPTLSPPQQLEHVPNTVQVAPEGSIQVKKLRIVELVVSKEVLAELQMDCKHSGSLYHTKALNSKQDDRPLQMSKHWSEDIWRRFTTASVVPMSMFFSSLGLRTLHKGDMVDHPAGGKLMKDVNQAAADLYGSLRVEELVEAAAYYDFLDEALAVLLEEYAPKIWAADADRSQLLQAGAVEAYPKNLTYEDEDDRKTLHLHMHQWIFAKAFANLRMSADTEEARADTRKALEQQIVPVNALKPNSRKRKTTSKTTVSSRPPTKKQKFHNAAIAERLTTAFLAYLSNTNADITIEIGLLKTFEFEFALIANQFSPVADKHNLFDAFPQAIRSWLTYRRAIVSVHRDACAPPPPHATKARTKIVRSQLLSELRFTRDVYIASTQKFGMSNEEYICSVFEMMQDSEKEGKKVKRKIEKGFKLLDEKLWDLGNELGCGEWVLMGDR